MRRLARATGAPLVGLSLLVGSAWGADVRGQPAKGQFKVVVFDEAFLSQRDRPYVDQILEKMGKSRSR